MSDMTNRKKQTVMSDFLKLSQMKLKLVLIATVILSVVVGCSKKDQTTNKNRHKFPPPQWQIDKADLYAYSMTTVILIPDTIEQVTSKNDQVAAFIGEECRGISEYIDRGNLPPVFYLMIKGAADESRQITLKYYNTKSAYMYVTPAFLNFEVDANYGTVDSPASPTFRPM